MSEFVTFARLGFAHITDPNGLDHVLFLIALAAVYRPRDWRRILWVITAFTVGHSLTLALAVTGVVRFPQQVIEFLIPVTIVATCVENIAVANRERAPWRGMYRPVFAGVFGLVHGAGFANYLRDLFADRLALPLLGFNVGIEIGQIVVLLLASAALLGFDELVKRLRSVKREDAVVRLRTIAVSSTVLIVAGRWAIERAPW